MAARSVWEGYFECLAQQLKTPVQFLEWEDIYSNVNSSAPYHLEVEIRFNKGLSIIEKIDLRTLRQHFETWKQKKSS